MSTLLAIVAVVPVHVANGPHLDGRLGSTLFAVYTRSQGTSGLSIIDEAAIPWSAGLRAASTQVLLLKLSYLWF